MMYDVTDIEFDFTDSQGELDKWEQDQIVKNNIGAVGSDIGSLTKASKRGPKPNKGIAKKHGKADHNQAIDDMVGSLQQDKRVSNIRKNQAQVDASGNKMGRNRPDVQFDLDGKHYNIEMDRTLRNSNKHKNKINTNDPNSQFIPVVF